MSCGVRYEFSLVSVLRPAELIPGDAEQIGTPQDAQEAGPADERRSEADGFESSTAPRGRTRVRREPSPKA